jgi:hypothetical protein
MRNLQATRTRLPATPTPQHRLLTCLGAGGLALLAGLIQVFAQVGPAEIKNPRLKASEQAYLTQLIAINRAISEVKFPFEFSLNRYAGLDPKDQIGADKRGLEFVNFHDREVMKVTGNYNAAFDADQLTTNQLAGRVFNEVIVPILRLLPNYFSPRDDFDAFGLEIAYHTSRRARSYRYEGKEILVVVLNKNDALSYTGAADERTRQVILNRSEIFLNGKPFGLALGSSDPIDLEALERPAADHPADTRASLPASNDLSRGAVAAPPVPAAQDPSVALQKAPVPHPAVSVPDKIAGTVPTASVKPDIEGLQKRYQPLLDDLAREGTARYHFVDYAPPSFVIFRDRASLQLTLRNPESFDRDTTSIYKRAARSFDLFLAPELKPILDKIGDNNDFSQLDASIINELASKAAKSSEAIEFILPLKAARRFAGAEITNQELIDQSIVLVNGVRIALNLQQVE